MTNSELNSLVTLYCSTKEKLKSLMGDYEAYDMEAKVTAKIEEILGDRFKNAKQVTDKMIFEGIYNGVLYKEASESAKRKKEFSNKISTPEVQQEIEYLKIKLEAIRQLFGVDIQKITDAEEGNILRKI
jgi:hypothetical protein